MSESILRVVTTPQLRRIVRRSEECGLSRLPSDLLWDEIAPDGKHVLQAAFLPGEEGFVRTFAMCKLKKGSDPAELWIDVTTETWERLPKEANE